MQLRDREFFMQLRDRAFLSDCLLNTHNVHVLLPDILYELTLLDLLANPFMFHQSIFIGRRSLPRVKGLDIALTLGVALTAAS